MNWLETKILPLLLVIFIGTAMWITSEITVSIAILTYITHSLSVITVLIGLAFVIAGVISFRYAHTTVDPMHPEKSNALVTSGIYQKTRNPMYVGFFCFLIAWAVYLGNVFSLLIACIFIPYMNRFQIQPEEKMLEQLFGDEYRAYLSDVQRWL